MVTVVLSPGAIVSGSAVIATTRSGRPAGACGWSNGVTRATMTGRGSLTAMPLATPLVS